MQESLNIRVDAKYIPALKDIVKGLNGKIILASEIKKLIADKVDDEILSREVNRALSLKQNRIRVDNIDEF